MSTPPHLRLPAGAVAHMVATDRGEFAIHDIDPPGDVGLRGSAVFVPGFTGSKEDFLLLLEPLAAAGFRVRVMDQRGQFETPGPDEPAAYRIDALGLDVLAIAADLPRPVHLVGHSFGGFAVRAAAIADPAAVTTVTLLCSGPGPLTVQREIDRVGTLIAALDNFPIPAIWSFITTTAEAAGEYESVTPEVREFLERRFLSSAHVGLSAMATQLLDAPGSLDELITSDVPVLVAHGVDDYIWLPVEQEDMARRLGAQYAVIPGAAHSPAVEQPCETVAVLVSFWTAHTKPNLKA